MTEKYYRLKTKGAIFLQTIWEKFPELRKDLNFFWKKE